MMLKRLCRWSILKRRSLRRTLWNNNTWWRIMLKRLCRRWILKRRASVRRRLWNSNTSWRMMLKRLCRW
jgi:hypothetical protein